MYYLYYNGKVHISEGYPLAEAFNQASYAYFDNSSAPKWRWRVQIKRYASHPPAWEHIAEEGVPPEFRAYMLLLDKA